MHVWMLVDLWMKMPPISRVLVIDLDEVYSNTPDDGLRIGANAAAEIHLALRFGRLGLGFYTDTYDLSRTVVPRTFIGLITQGNEPDQTYNGSSEILQRAFAQAGTFASYQIGGFVVAGKFGAFSPMLYSDENAQAGFTLETASDGTIRGEVFASGDIYTAFGEDGFQGLGFNVSLGLVRPDEEGKPLAGSDALTTDLQRGEIQWKEGNLAEHKGKAARLRFTLRDASLYSYWFEE